MSELHLSVVPILIRTVVKNLCNNKLINRVLDDIRHDNIGTCSSRHFIRLFIPSYRVQTNSLLLHRHAQPKPMLCHAVSLDVPQ